MFNSAELYQNLYDIVDIIVNYYYNAFNHIEQSSIGKSRNIVVLISPSQQESLLVGLASEGGVQVQTGLGIVCGK